MVQHHHCPGEQRAQPLISAHEIRSSHHSLSSNIADEVETGLDVVEQRLDGVVNALPKQLTDLEKSITDDVKATCKQTSVDSLII